MLRNLPLLLVILAGNSFAQGTVEAKFSFKMNLAVSDGKKIERSVDQLVFTEKDLLEKLKANKKKPAIVFRRQLGTDLPLGVLRTTPVVTIDGAEDPNTPAVKVLAIDPALPEGMQRGSFSSDLKQTVLAQSEGFTFDAGEVLKDGLEIHGKFLGNTKSIGVLSKGNWLLKSQTTEAVGGVQIKLIDANGLPVEINAPATVTFTVGAERVEK